MTGKKKDIKGGMFGFIPNQPKYNPDTVSKETFNELFEKLEREQSFLNKLRTKQRFKHFLTILNHKLQSNDVENTEKQKILGYFTTINNKYKNNLSEILSSDNRELYNYIKSFSYNQTLNNSANKSKENIVPVFAKTPNNSANKPNDSKADEQKTEYSNKKKIYNNGNLIHIYGKKIIDSFIKKDIIEFKINLIEALKLINNQIQRLNESKFPNKKLIIDALVDTKKNYLEMKRRLEDELRNNNGAGVAGSINFTGNNGAGMAGLNNNQIELVLKSFTDNKRADVVGLTNNQMQLFLKNFNDKKGTNTTKSNKNVKYVLSMFNECYKLIKKFKLGRIKIKKDAELENEELKEYFKNLYEGFYASYFDLMLKFKFSESQKEILYKKKLEIDKFYNQNKIKEKFNNSNIKKAANKIGVYKTPLFPRPNLHNA